MKNARRVLSLVLVVCMVLSLMPTAFAAEAAGGTASIGGLDNTWMTKYGNVNTDCQAADFFQTMGFTWGDMVNVKFLSQDLDLPVVPTYHYVDSGKPAIIVNKGEDGNPTGAVSLAINMGNFATTYGIAEKHTNEDKTYYWTAMEGVTFPVELTFSMKEAGGYMAEYLLHDLNRTNNREDYPNLTDEQFANFRNIATTGMGAGVLYRSSSPINPELGRNTYADKAAEKAGIKTFINLADDADKAATYAGFSDSYYSKQNIAFLNLGVDFNEASFQNGLADGFRFMTTHEGPYLVHCTEGKDRAGYISALLECFMGATYDEVVADYMTTYINYYGVELGSEKYDAIANSNIIKSLKNAFGVDDLQTADLKAGAEGYMKRIGLSEEELQTLRANLSTGEQTTATYELVADSGNMLKYGHLDMNVSTEDFLKNFHYGDIVTVSFFGKSYDFPVCSNYDDVDTGKLLIRAAAGKNVVTLAINYGQLGVEAGIIEKAPEGAATKYQVKEGVNFPITATVTMKQAGGYSDELSMRQLNRTNNREDYPELTDEQFANFRNISTTGMGNGILYRSSSPVNPEIGRNTYADAAAKTHRIKTFVNLADSQEEAESYEGYAGSYYSHQNVTFLNLPVAFFSDEFKAGLAEGFRFIASHEGPYLVHCTEGKDRAGMTSAVLECFMGASADEVVADYITTFRNYYNVVDGKQTALTEAQEAYLRKTVLTNLGLMFGIEDAATEDLASAAYRYMQAIGLTEEEITALRHNLSQSVDVRAETTVSAVTEIDKYGDVRLSITSGELRKLGFEYADYVRVEILGRRIKVPVIPEYRYVGAREAGLVMWRDDSKPVELEIFNGSFASTYGIATKTTNPDKTYFWTPCEAVTFPIPVGIFLEEAGGYQDQYEIYDLVRTNAREDYADLTDEQFANFRAVTTTGMGEDILYRSSSPINPEIGRNTYADAAAKAHGIKTVMNLADSQSKAEAYEGYAESYYAKQNVVFLGLGVDFLSNTNRKGLAEGLRYFATHEGPYLVHCNEGQDRAGFTSALLECLMGATLAEVKADYATTFQNYYGVKEGTKQYETISGNIEKNLKLVFGVDTLEGADLAELAENYILGLGLTKEEVLKLRSNLGGEISMEDYLNMNFYQWFATAKTDYEITGMMVSKDTEVYNRLEDVHYTAKPNGEDVILTGTVGEQWVTRLSKVIKTYTKLDGSALTAADFQADTAVPLKTIPEAGYFAYFIPAEYHVSVQTAWGDVLHANREGVEHGDGDYLICRAGENGQPDLSDTWIVNGAVFPNTYSLHPFTDVPKNAWYTSYVTEAYQNGLVLGVSDGTKFAPAKVMTRAEWITMLYRVYGEPENVATTTHFTDVQKGSYYYNAVIWAEEYGVLRGVTATTCAPMQELTREQMVTMLQRCASSEEEYDQTALSRYADAAEIHNFARSAVAWATEAGIVCGSTSGKFAPRATATRAEAAKVLVVFANILTK